MCMCMYMPTHNLGQPCLNAYVADNSVKAHMLIKRDNCGPSTVNAQMLLP